MKKSEYKIRNCDWTVEDIKLLIQKFNDGLSNIEIGKLFNKNPNSICWKLLKLGYRRTNKPFDTDTVSKIINLYNAGNSSPSIAKELNTGHKNILDCLKRNNIDRRKSKWDIDENYFDIINTEDKAYFLGLMYADGNVSSDKGTWSIKLQERDIIILEKFNACIQYNKPLSLILAKETTHQNQFCIHSSNTNLIHDLIKQGCIPAKSLILQFPTEEQVPKEFQRHFIRGYFDGDGSSRYSNKKCYWKVLGTLDFVESIKNILIQEVGVNNTKITKSGNIYIYQTGNFKNVFDIREWLYKDATVYLERKYQLK